VVIEWKSHRNRLRCAEGSFETQGVQVIYRTALSVEQYIEKGAQAWVKPDLVCRRCGKATVQHSHGTYERAVVGALGEVLVIRVARYLCLGCARTTSYLPNFALSYRLLRREALEAYLDGILGGRDVQRWMDLLHTYRRRMAAHIPELLRTLGCGLGRAPPDQGCSVQELLKWLRVACGSLETATGRLVSQFKTSLFKRYQCHQTH
jgi:transposase-like protein